MLLKVNSEMATGSLMKCEVKLSRGMYSKCYTLWVFSDLFFSVEIDLM